MKEAKIPYPEGRGCEAERRLKLEGRRRGFTETEENPKALDLRRKGGEIGIGETWRGEMEFAIPCFLPLESILACSSKVGHLYIQARCESDINSASATKIEKSSINVTQMKYEYWG